MKALVLSVLGVGLVVGLIGPDLREPADTGEHAIAVDQPSSQLQVATRPEWSGGEIAIPQAGDGHYYASVQVDSRDLQMLVDTGASTIALTGDDARDIGLTWDPTALVPVAKGANGTVMGVRTVLREVAVGDFVARDVEAIIVPEGLPISLLGQSFLSHVGNVQIADNTLTLSD